MLLSRQFVVAWSLILMITFLIIVWLKLITQQLTISSPSPIICPIEADSTFKLNPSPLKTAAYYKSYINQEEAFRKRFTKRLKLFHRYSRSPWKNPWGIFFWDAFIPTMSCPHFLQRIGAPGGGGKWICGFELFEIQNSRVTNFMDSEANLAPPPCVLFSFGVGPDSSFEAEFLTRTDCIVYMFDHTSGAPRHGPGVRLPPRTEKRWTYERVGLGNHSNWEIRTLGDTMRKYGVEWIDFLKVDIEWNEFTVFEQIMEEFEILPFGQLNLEIHLQDTGYFNVQDRKEYDAFHAWWTGLIDHGLRAFNWEVNFYPVVIESKKPFAVEYSFLNVKRNPILLMID